MATGVPYPTALLGPSATGAREVTLLDLRTVPDALNRAAADVTAAMEHVLHEPVAPQPLNIPAAVASAVQIRRPFGFGGTSVAVWFHDLPPTSATTGFILDLRRSDDVFVRYAVLDLVLPLRRVTRTGDPGVLTPELGAFLADPATWTASTHRGAHPRPLDAATLHEAIAWAAAGVARQWQVRRWRRYHVTRALDLAHWRTLYDSDTKIEQVAPYVSHWGHARIHRSLPPREMSRWASIYPAFNGLLDLARERGFRPGHIELLLHATRGDTRTPLRAANQDDLLWLLRARDGVHPLHLARAFEAGLTLPEVTELVTGGTLAASQPTLRTMAALR